MGGEFNMRRSRVEGIRIVVRKSEGKESLRKPRGREGNNIALGPKGEKNGVVETGFHQSRSLP
jgi:hypothetical protein